MIYIIDSSQQSTKELKHLLVHTGVTQKTDQNSKFKIHVTQISSVSHYRQLSIISSKNPRRANDLVGKTAQMLTAQMCTFESEHPVRSYYVQ